MQWQSWEKTKPFKLKLKICKVLKCSIDDILEIRKEEEF